MSADNHNSTFADAADSELPQIVVAVDGSIPLTDAERAIRDGLFRPFVILIRGNVAMA